MKVEGFSHILDPVWSFSDKSINKSVKPPGAAEICQVKQSWWVEVALLYLLWLAGTNLIWATQRLGSDYLLSP